MNPTEKKSAPVYASWKTVQNAIETLSKAAVPNVIDRSVFPGLNWAVQSHLLSGFRFLGLMEDDGRPTPVLMALVHDGEKRKENWAQILRECYPDLIGLDLTRATLNQVLDTFKGMGLSAETTEKAVRFFLSAAEFAELPMSVHLQGKKASSGQRKRRPTPRSKPVVEEEEASTAPASPKGTSRSIALRSGGVLTMTASVDLFAMSSEDRQFVFGLIDQIQSYEKQDA